MSKAIISQFYQAFQTLDAEGMVKCYHPEIKFEDPAFGPLKGVHAGNMWRMLCASQKDKGMKVTFEVRSDDSAHWEAHYIFSKTGRKVHNKIDAQFAFEDGLIIKHTDHFDLHRWAGMAMGLQGKLIGWTPFFKKKLHQQTNYLLSKYESRL